MKTKTQTLSEWAARAAALIAALEAAEKDRDFHAGQLAQAEARLLTAAREIDDFRQAPACPAAAPAADAPHRAEEADAIGRLNQACFAEVGDRLRLGDAGDVHVVEAVHRRGDAWTLWVRREGEPAGTVSGYLNEYRLLPDGRIAAERGDDIHMLKYAPPSPPPGAPQRAPEAVRALLDLPPEVRHLGETFPDRMILIRAGTRHWFFRDGDRGAALALGVSDGFEDYPAGVTALRAAGHTVLIADRCGVVVHDARVNEKAWRKGEPPAQDASKEQPPPACPPRDQVCDALEAALWTDDRANTSWTRLIASGATDNEVLLELRSLWAHNPCGEESGGWYARGGQAAAFWHGQTKPKGKSTLSGKALLAAVRESLGIAKPNEKEAAKKKPDQAHLPPPATDPPDTLLERITEGKPGNAYGGLAHVLSCSVCGACHTQSDPCDRCADGADVGGISIVGEGYVATARVWKFVESAAVTGGAILRAKPGAFGDWHGACLDGEPTKPTRQRVEEAIGSKCGFPVRMGEVFDLDDGSLVLEFEAIAPAAGEETEPSLFGPLPKVKTSESSHLSEKL